MIHFEKNGITISLVALSVFIIPYLYILNTIIGNAELLNTMGKWIAVIAIIYLWIVFIVFKLMKRKKLTASAITSLLAVPTTIIISGVVTRFIQEPMIDVWDVLTYSILIILAIVLFGMERIELHHSKRV